MRDALQQPPPCSAAGSVGFPGFFIASPQQHLHFALSTGGHNPGSGSPLSGDVRGLVLCSAAWHQLKVSPCLPAQGLGLALRGSEEQTHLATGTTQDLEHHLLVTPGFSGRLP